MTTSAGQSRKASVSKASVSKALIAGDGGSFSVRHVDYEGWVFDLTMAKGVIVGLCVTTSGGVSITKRTLSALPLQEIEAAPRALISGKSDVRMSGHARAALEELDEKKKQKNRLLAELCRDYVALGSAPIRTLAEKRCLSEKRIRNLLSEARAVGLMTAGTPGRAGGVLTDKAKEILDGKR